MNNQAREEKLREILADFITCDIHSCGIPQYGWCRKHKKQLDAAISQINQLFSERKEEKCPSCGAKLKITVLDKIIRKSCEMCPYEQTENVNANKTIGKDKEVEEAIELLEKVLFMEHLTFAECLDAEFMINSVKKVHKILKDFVEKKR